ncbi:hypothetical protein C1646_728071, partial [Rhizophagus diaphanus]
MRENLKKIHHIHLFIMKIIYCPLPVSPIFFRYQNFEASLSAQYPLRRLVLILAPEHFQ